MRTKQTTQNIQDTFLLGLSGVFRIAGITKSFFRHWTMIASVILSVLTLILCYWLGLDILEFISEFKSLMLDFLPGILGFTIAGYSLMVGFIQAGAMSRISEPFRDSKFSLYQKMSATFALNILLQAIALIVAYFIHFVLYLNENKIGIDLSVQFVQVVNPIGLALLSYWFFVSLFMVIQIVVNIFSFSQLHHYFVNKEKVEEQQKNGSVGPNR